MLLWLKTNLPTILVAAAVLAVVIGVIIKMVRDKKSGRSSCGCECANCPNHGNCHKK